ncbi:hypothetical protein NP233_g3748 [Leucocoprinus birnbaumii]|uniref:Uncharacterized protein n=1 Tax=Leucocoprinus birnbaumii TaxID=56174 RepID=A0AAD5VVZ3_9AGAR|nr:hypothetical protein NP233_g3748 [Leucocoprinus birnbaumii]
MQFSPAKASHQRPSLLNSPSAECPKEVMDSDSLQPLRTFERFDLVSNTTLAGVQYGIILVLCCQCLPMFYRDYRRGDRPKQVMILGVQALVILVATTIFFLAQTITMVSAYIDFNDGGKGPLLYVCLTVMVKSSVMFWLFIGSMPITDILLTATEGWRIWRIWENSPYALCAVAVHFVLYLTKVGVLIAGISMYLNYGPHAGDEDSALKSNLEKLAAGFDEDPNRKSNLEKLAAVDMAIQALQAIQQFVAFCLICGRIILIHRPITHLTMLQPKSTQFTNLVTMLTESYALSTIVSAAMVFTTPAIASKSGAPGELIIKMMCRYVEIISYYLLLYRILSGRAWNRNTDRELTSLQWACHASAISTGSAVEAPPAIARRPLPRGNSANWNRLTNLPP